ncbi:MAG: hypothetical protein LBE12_11430 [Planctomycetaceae bacterium]|jgi:hypothetical protein|nr:hypothetical protein [Planctomycetaceae bacterium]
MKKIELIIVLLFFIFLSLALFSGRTKPETEFPQLSAEVNYAEVEKRIEWTKDFIQKENSFHKWAEHPALRKLNDVPNYETNLYFYYKKFENKTYRLNTIMIYKQSPKRNQDITVGFYNDRTLSSYSEFFQGHNLQIYIAENSKPSNISFINLAGERKIKFDENGKVLTDSYQKHTQQNIRKYLGNKQQMEAEIRDSIAAGYTDIQKKQPLEWQLKLPAKIKDMGVRNRLLKIGEYHRAIIAGNSRPLVENPVFDVDAETFRVNNGYIPLTVQVSYSGQKVAFVGVEVFRDSGYFMVFDEYARLQKYVEGEIEFNKKLTGYKAAKAAKLFLRDFGYEKNRKASGIEITFHPTGCPASYKTIVKGNLFGRQAEWNDQGEVIFDEDYDIPKLQKDTP